MVYILIVLTLTMSHTDLMTFIFGDLTPDMSVSNYSIDEVHQATTEILQLFGLECAKEFAACAIDVYPHLTFTSLVLANVFHVYLWLLDDKVDNPKTPAELSEKLITESVTALTDPNSVTHPICKLGVYLLTQFKHPLMTAFIKDELHLYYEGVKEHLASGCTSRVTTTRMTDDKTITTLTTNLTKVLRLDEFLRIRLKDGAVCAALPLGFQDVTDFRPYYDYFCSEVGRESFRLANLNICIVNDLHSTESRDVLEQSTFNVVNSHMAEYQLTREDSIKLLVNDCNMYYQQLANYQDELGITRILLRWCEGSLRWHTAAQRYKAQRMLQQ